MLGKLGRTGYLRGTLNYNEEKVAQEKAAYLHAENYLKDSHELTFEDKFNRLHDRVTLNETAHLKVAHIFLTFHPRDEICNETMVQMAQRYVQAAGFGDQPYLVYRHFDAGNPHLHIVSTHVLPDRKMIETPPRLLKELHTLTQAMEVEIGLRPNIVQAPEAATAQSTRAEEVVYGQPSLKRAIGSVLNAVIDHYRYTSLEDLNAILREYNVKADGGREGTRLHQHGGLVYAVLDEQGAQISRGIWASSFEHKPTLPYLEKKFELNRELREESRQHVETAIEWTLTVAKPDWPDFREALGREGINVVVQEGREGKQNGVFFVDHREKAVFSGTDLGSQFNLQDIQEKCLQNQRIQEEETQRHHLKLHL